MSTPDHRHPLFARIYPRVAAGAEAHGAADHRRRLLAGLRGRVIEVGAGNGLNFGHYPSSVDEVLAVEPEPHLRELALQAAATAPVPVRVVPGAAEQLPAGDSEFDAAVVSLVLCSVPDQALALAEVRRALRAGGELRFYEHVVSRRQAAARMQRLADATVWPRIAAGCHMARDTAEAIRRAGFEIREEQRIAFKPGALSPSVPHILGIAVTTAPSQNENRPLP